MWSPSSCVCTVFSSLGLNKDQSLQAFYASTASTNFKDIFERMKIISLYVACKIRVKDAQILPKRAETELSLLICFCHMQWTWLVALLWLQHGAKYFAAQCFPKKLGTLHLQGKSNSLEKLILEFPHTALHLKWVQTNRSDKLGYLKKKWAVQTSEKYICVGDILITYTFIKQNT